MFGEDPQSGTQVVALQFALPPLVAGGRDYLARLTEYLKRLAPAIGRGDVVILPATAAALMRQALKNSEFDNYPNALELSVLGALEAMGQMLLTGQLDPSLASNILSGLASKSVVMPAEIAPQFRATLERAAAGDVAHQGVDVGAAIDELRMALVYLAKPVDGDSTAARVVITAGKGHVRCALEQLGDIPAPPIELELPELQPLTDKHDDVDEWKRRAQRASFALRQALQALDPIETWATSKDDIALAIAGAKGHVHGALNNIEWFLTGARPQCLYCGCTEDKPCMTPIGEFSAAELEAVADEYAAIGVNQLPDAVPCSWIRERPWVCSAPACEAKDDELSPSETHWERDHMPVQLLGADGQPIRRENPR